MLRFFRRLTKTKVGMGIMAILPIGALAGFAIGDISNFGSGNIGFGMGSSQLAKVGNQIVTEREMSEAMQRRLQEVRREKPEADYATIAGDFETLLNALIDQRTLINRPEPNCDRLISVDSDAAWAVVLEAIVHFSS